MTEPKYVFWVELYDGTVVRWPRLTMTQARNMHLWTEKVDPTNVARFGWEEM